MMKKTYLVHQWLTIQEELWEMGECALSDKIMDQVDLVDLEPMDEVEILLTSDEFKVVLLLDNAVNVPMEV